MGGFALRCVYIAKKVLVYLLTASFIFVLD